MRKICYLCDEYNRELGMREATKIDGYFHRFADFSANGHQETKAIVERENGLLDIICPSMIIRFYEPPTEKDSPDLK